MKFNLLHCGALSMLALTLPGCYVATPYGYRAYGAPVYTAYPAVRYPSYPVQYVQPGVAYPPVAQPASVTAPVLVSGVAGSVYFDVNSAIVKPEYQAVVQAQADYLREHPDARVTLQGNADDRGASAYNLSLGDKRAEAVKRALEQYGVAASQISTVSLGDKHPTDSARDEAAYAKNRRVDFDYP